MTEINETQVPELKEKLIKEIEKEITKKGLSQAQVGDLAGMSRVNINKLLKMF